jgi:ribosomal protein S18 acetylase RimI-like enzyme
MIPVTVSPATPDDVPAMAALLEEMDRFYGATNTEPAGERERQIREALFATPPTAYALLAFDNDQLVGMAAYSFLWPAVRLTRSLYLKELYVAERGQRHGIGRALMAALFEVASKHGCSRVEWTTDHDNPGAVAFYAALGAPAQPSKILYRIEDTGTGLHLPA